MLFPYRTKNPAEHFPICTIVLMSINILIYLLTSYDRLCLAINDSALRDFAVSHNTFNPLRLTSAMFLHADIMHLAGNMWFLWLFGAAAEGRLRPVKFLILYFAAGYTGGILSDFVNGVASPDSFSLGASGAIMGVAGAYLYLFPFAEVRVFYWITLWFWGKASWRAMWVILLYIGLDFVSAFLLRSRDGVGHFAHIGGFAAGLLMVFALRAKRDTEAVSEVQATLADAKDYSLLSIGELETLLQKDVIDLNLVMAYLAKAGSYGGGGGRFDIVSATFTKFAPRLFAEANPNELAPIVLSLWMNTLPLVYLLRLGSRLEQVTSNSMALQIYKKIYETSQTATETEVSLFRTARLMQNVFMDRPYAISVYHELLRLFPHGDFALQARQSLKQLGV